MIGILKGLGVTLKHQFTRAITLQYPKERPEIPERSRGWIELDSSKCTGCGLCAKSCPISVITVKTGISEDGKRFVEQWDVRTDRCMFCGICTEACALGILKMVPRYELATTNKAEIRNVQISSEQDLASAAEKICPVKDECREAGDE